MRRIGRCLGRSSARKRAAVAAIIAIVCLSFVTIVGTLLLQTGQAERRYTNTLEAQAQAEWLVEAGASRAAARLAKSSGYPGETWSIPASRLGGSHAGVVHIEVKSDPSQSTRRTIKIAAELNAENATAVRAEREFQLSAKEPRTK
jgi:hypothetical protein